EGNEMDYNMAGYGCAGALCIIPIIMLIISIAIAIWVYKDAEKRGKSGALWLVIVVLTSIIGLIIWFVVRPKEIVKPPAAPGT
ncbi:MAG: hypothetical protein KKB04_03365, partial [Candidatus Thermoplasmatota archaeon]|nr:hypothetical protein [Candidatus Thermoplasmatota archaeon]